jgi:hypothetical protein
MNFAFLSAHQNEIAFVVTSLVGAVTHYLKKLMKNETSISLFDWFGKSNPTATAYTALVFTFALIGMLSSGFISSSMTIWASMYTGFATGFAIDSGFNADGTLTNQLTTAKSDVGNFLNKMPH